MSVSHAFSQVGVNCLLTQKRQPGGGEKHNTTPARRPRSALAVTPASCSESKTSLFLRLLPVFTFNDSNQNGIKVICKGNRGHAS